MLALEEGAAACRKPKRRQAPSAGQARQLAKMSAASAMKPMPAVISRTKLDDREMEMKVPAMPQRTPVMITAM